MNTSAESIAAKRIVFLVLGIAPAALLGRCAAAGNTAPEETAVVDAASQTPFSGLCSPRLSLEAPIALDLAQLTPALPRMSALLTQAEPLDPAARLEAAGFHDFIRAKGLVLWHVLPYRTRSGERIALGVSLPPEAEATKRFKRDGEDPKRSTALQKRLTALRERIVSEAARILNIDGNAILVQGRLIETCCAKGCDSCLLHSSGRRQDRGR